MSYEFLADKYIKTTDDCIIDILLRRTTIFGSGKILLMEWESQHGAEKDDG
jgi:hypothetical protein